MSIGVYKVSIDKNISTSIGPFQLLIDSSSANVGTIIDMSIDLSVYGIYVSLDCASSLNTGASSSTSVDSHMNEGRTKIFQIGYKVPIINRLYIYPLVGYANVTTGYCDGRNYTVNKNGIHNHYVAENVLADGIDYGAGMDFRIGNYILLSGKFTRYTMGVSLGFILDFNRIIQS